MLTAQVEIKGTRPLLFNHFHGIPNGKQEQNGVPGNNPEEWKKSFTARKNGQLYVDHSYIFGSLRSAAKYTKVGMGSIQPKLSATLQVTDTIVLVDRWVPEEVTTDPEQPVYLDIRPVIMPKTRGRNIRYRLACAPDWAMTFHLLWDEVIVSRQKMETVTLDAGSLIGLGDGRNIGFGRFRVTSFEVNDYAKVTTP